MIYITITDSASRMRAKITLASLDALGLKAKVIYAGEAHEYFSRPQGTVLFLKAGVIIRGAPSTPEFGMDYAAAVVKEHCFYVDNPVYTQERKLRESTFDSDVVWVDTNRLSMSGTQPTKPMDLDWLVNEHLRFMVKALPRTQNYKLHKETEVEEALRADVLNLTNAYPDSPLEHVSLVALGTVYDELIKLAETVDAVYTEQLQVHLLSVAGITKLAAMFLDLKKEVDVIKASLYR